jgi:L-threonylcarbamoyladenylate synthase
MDIILAEGVEENGLGFAIMNRLQKASGQRILRV